LHGNVDHYDQRVAGNSKVVFPDSARCSETPNVPLSTTFTFHIRPYVYGVYDKAGYELRIPACIERVVFLDREYFGYEQDR